MEDLFLTVRGGEQVALRVRPEIRGDLIALLRRDRPKFNQFNESAAAYYRGLGTAEANAAAAYHLLQLERVDDAAEVVGGRAKLPELLGDAAEELPEGVREALRGRGFSAQRPIVENLLEQALHEAAELEKAGRPVLALEQLLSAEPDSNDRAWQERVVHLAGLAGDIGRLKDILATSAVSPETAAAAIDAAGVPLDDELSHSVLDAVAASVDSLTSPNQLRALLAVASAGGSAANEARHLLRRVPPKYRMKELARTEPELARRYAAEVGSRDDLLLALEFELLDRTWDLDLSPLLEAVGGDARARRLIEEGQREDNLSHSLLVLLSHDPSLEAPVRELMHQSVNRPSAPSGATVAVKDRASALEALAAWIGANLDRPAWIALASEVIGTEVVEFEKVAGDRAVRFMLYAIDRRGKLERFGALLVARYPAASLLLPALERLSEARTAKA